MKLIQIPFIIFHNHQKNRIYGINSCKNQLDIGEVQHMRYLPFDY